MRRFFIPVSDEFQSDEAERDLLGDPVDMARDSWGRPGFEITKKKQQRVKILAAAGWKQERIARHIGCDTKTLRKHFSRELTHAADDAEAEALTAVM